MRSMWTAGLPVSRPAQLPLRLGGAVKPPRGSTACVGTGGGPAGGRTSSAVWALGTPGGCTLLALALGLMALMRELELVPPELAVGQEECEGAICDALSAAGGAERKGVAVSAATDGAETVL